MQTCMFSCDKGNMCMVVGYVSAIQCYEILGYYVCDLGLYKILVSIFLALPFYSFRFLHQPLVAGLVQRTTTC